MSRSRLFSGAALVAVLGASGMGGMVATSIAESAPTVKASQPSPVKNSPAPQDQQRRTNPVRRMAGGAGTTRGDSRRAGPGWSNRHVKRLAKKSRNVKRARSGSR